MTRYSVRLNALQYSFLPLQHVLRLFSDTCSRVTKHISNELNV